MGEIDLVSKEIPTDRVPWFSVNGMFLNKWWSIVKQEYIKIVNSFHVGDFNLKFINITLLTLIPK
jgi:hypothetical protein